MQEPRNKQREGFTVLELLIIIVIVAVIAVAGIGGLFKYRGSQDLRLALGEISSVIRETQRKSVTQEDGKRWGIRFENPQNDRGRLLVFKGLNYATGTVTNTISIRRGVEFGEPYSSSTYDIVFLPVEGTTALKKVITLNTGIPGALVGDLVVNLLGRVTSRSETGLVGYWHLDEGTSTAVYDASGNGMDGTFTVAPTWTSGTGCKAGECLLFTSDRITVASPNPIIGSSPFSLSAWINVDSPSDYALAAYIGSDAVAQSAWIGWVQGAQVGVSNSIGGGFFGRNYGSGITDTNDWHHVVLTFSGGTLGTAKIYVDGVERVSESYTPNLASGVVTFGHPSYPYSGGLDEVRLYSRALTAEEIGNIYSDLK